MMSRPWVKVSFSLKVRTTPSVWMPLVVSTLEDLGRVVKRRRGRGGYRGWPMDRKVLAWVLYLAIRTLMLPRGATACNTVYVPP